MASTIELQKIATMTPFSNRGLTDSWTTFCLRNVSYLKQYKEATSKTRYFVEGFYRWNVRIWLQVCSWISKMPSSW